MSMATDKQIEANRANALLSTGPKTEEGKERSSQNAIKHGFHARQIVIDDEEKDFFQEFADRITEDLRPRDQIELSLVDQIISCLWRLRRIPRIEADLFRALLDKPSKTLGEHLTAKESMGLYSMISQQEIRLGKSLQRALKELRDLKSEEMEEINENEANRFAWLEEPAVCLEELQLAQAAAKEDIDHLDQLAQDRKELNEILDGGARIAEAQVRALNIIDSLGKKKRSELSAHEYLTLESAKLENERTRDRMRAYCSTLARIQARKNGKTKPIEDSILRDFEAARKKLIDPANGRASVK
jgi:hypothetical protein